MAQEVNGFGNLTAGRDLNVTLNVESLTHKSSKIAKVISALSVRVEQEVLYKRGAITDYKIEEKISYNNLVRYRDLIDKYGSYGGLIESICIGLDADKPNTKLKMFDYINTLYLSERGRFLKGDMEPVKIARENSDKIIDGIYLQLLDLVKGSSEMNGIDEEDIRAGVLSLVAVAFINCDILERPPLN